MQKLVPAASLVLTLALPLASAAGRGDKTPRPLPVMEDVKTPEPPTVTGTSLLPESSMTTQVPARSGRPAQHAPTHAVQRAPEHASPHVLDRVLTSGSEDGAIWARGRAYKARFDAGGATFVPFFGSEAPANHPVRFTTSSVAVGDAPIACGSAVPERRGEAVLFARGGLVERWQLTLDGVEQQFVLETLPAAGDVVITIDVETDLQASCDQGSIAFSNELGRVDYGAATAIDSEGQRFPMTSALSDGRIELRLASHDVARAHLPLVVDPVVNTFALFPSGIDDFAPDVAYDAASDHYLVVYEETYSATDHDVYAELLSADGNYVMADYIDYTSDYWATPRVANNAIAGNFLCVAAVGQPGSLRTIRGRTFHATSALMGNQFVIAGADNYDKVAPDVGGDGTLLPPTYYLVVWERHFTSNDQDIHARLVAADGTLVGPGTILIDNSANTFDERASISKSDGGPPFATQEWTIVWQRYDPNWGHYGIWGSQVHWDGAITHAPYHVDVTGDVTYNPSVSSLLDDDGVNRHYMVAYEIQSLGGDWDVLGTVFLGTTFLVGTDVGNQVDLATLDEDQIMPCVDSDGRHFTVAYAQSAPGGTENYDTIAADLVYAGDYPYVCESAILASTLEAELDPAITSQYSGGGARRRFLITWDKPNHQLGTSTVEAALYDGCEGGFTEPFCFGDGTATGCPCGNVGGPGNGCANSTNPGGANLSSTGNPQVSADTLALVTSGVGNGSVGLYFQGQPAGGYFGAVFGDGIRCLTSVIRRIGYKVNPMGSSQYPGPGDPLVSVKGAIPSAGAQAFYQVWYRDAGTFCMPSTFNLTNGLRVIWAP